MGYPEAKSEREILRATAGAARLDDMRSVLSGNDITTMQAEVENVRVDDALVDYALAIVAKTRDSEYFALGVSPRGSLMLYRAAQALAYLEGRNFCTPSDFKSLAVPVFAHRVVVDARYSTNMKKSEQSDQLLHEIVDSVAVPV
jgi:MoxR-like ATPase